MIKLKNQFSRISLFQTQNFRGAPKGAPKILTDPKNILTCSEWSNLNLEEKNWVNCHTYVAAIDRRRFAKGFMPTHPPPPPRLGVYNSIKKKKKKKKTKKKKKKNNNK